MWQMVTGPPSHQQHARHLPPPPARPLLISAPHAAVLPLSWPPSWLFPPPCLREGEASSGTPLAGRWQAAWRQLLAFFVGSAPPLRLHAVQQRCLTPRQMKAAAAAGGGAKGGRDDSVASQPHAAAGDGGGEGPPPAPEPLQPALLGLSGDSRRPDSVERFSEGGRLAGVVLSGSRFAGRQLLLVSAPECEVAVRWV
jgi:hypothetical protein